MTTLGSWILQFQERDGVAVEYKINNKWAKISWKEYLDKIISTSYFLSQLNIKDHTHVGIMSQTRWEWAVIDLAILGSGHITVPFYPNLSDDDFIFMVNHSEVEVLFIENDENHKQYLRIQNQILKKVKVVLMSEVDMNTSISHEMRIAYLKACSHLKSKDTATIVYTSGTTGQPKGAVLLHETIFSEVTESFDLFGIKKQYKSLTFLPFAHVLGRIEHWGSAYNGHTIAYAESFEKIKYNLIEVKPEFMITVPRLLEKFYAAIMAKIETQPFKLKIFRKALAVSKKLQYYRRTKQNIPWPLLIQFEALNQIAFSPVKNAFGGNFIFAISGGAPLSNQLGEFFSECGINILEGYGLTETCAAVTVNHYLNNQPGTVGYPIGDVHIKFAPDQEILIKSKKCFSEYYKDPEATALVKNNNYFATGDIGHLTPSGALVITDRKKDLIKTAGGKYVAPQKLEGLLKEDPLISQVLVHGDQKKYISVLISIDDSQIEQWFKNQNLEAPTDEGSHLSREHPAIKARIQQHIKKINSKLASYESIKRFEIVPDMWTVENGCLTQSLKVKRKFIEEKYAQLIKEMYE